MNRRDVIRTLPLASAGFLLARSGFALAGIQVDTRRFHDPSVAKSGESLEILFLGGTNFVGPPTVQTALDRGHRVTLFNRGLTNPYLFPELRKIRGDRDPGKTPGLAGLREGRWDVVIDTWQDSPVAVHETARLLNGRVGHYIYISSIAVYGEHNYEIRTEITEDAPLPATGPMPSDFSTVLSYPVSKTLSEKAVRETWSGTSTLIRPHSICGYYMPQGADNQLYWPARVNRGGDILTPGDGLDTTQYVDVEDLARFIVRAAETKLSGVFNTCRRQTFLEYLYGLKALTATASTFHWAPVHFLDLHGVRDFDQMPMWVPRSKTPGFFSISAVKAMAAGLSFRPMAVTFRDVLDGFYTFKSADFEFGVDGRTEGISRSREAELLKRLDQWKSQGSGQGL
ncbi:MAG: NAD-dependent epimerase/dehydratase family protein [Candidatus Polarisedimenticolia bacterium]